MRRGQVDPLVEYYRRRLPAESEFDSIRRRIGEQYVQAGLTYKNDPFRFRSVCVPVRHLGFRCGDLFLDVD